MSWLQLHHFEGLPVEATKVWPVWVTDIRLAVFWSADSDGGSLWVKHFDVAADINQLGAVPELVTPLSTDLGAHPSITKVETTPSGFLVHLEFGHDE